MDTNLLQAMIDIVFKGNMLYLAPVLFFMMAIIFADTLIGLISSAVDGGTGRRGKY